jgi:hypothetical protein
MYLIFKKNKKIETLSILFFMYFSQNSFDILIVGELFDHSGAFTDFFEEFT